MADLLKADGYEIDLATKGAEAINHLETAMTRCRLPMGTKLVVYFV